MDPNLFALDWERVSEILALVVVLAFFVERALSLVFEHRWYVDKLAKRGFKEPIAFGVAFAACSYWRIDAVSVIVVSVEQTALLGYAITAAVIAGGSKGAVKLFHDILDIRSDADAAAADA